MQFPIGIVSKETKQNTHTLQSSISLCVCVACCLLTYAVSAELEYYSLPYFIFVHGINFIEEIGQYFLSTQRCLDLFFKSIDWVRPPSRPMHITHNKESISFAEGLNFDDQCLPITCALCTAKIKQISALWISASEKKEKKIAREFHWKSHRQSKPKETTKWVIKSSHSNCIARIYIYTIRYDTMYVLFWNVALVLSPSDGCHSNRNATTIP